MAEWHTCGTVSKLQSYFSSLYNVVASPGVVILGSFSRSQPASIIKTDVLVSAVRRLANTNPAVPPPTMMKSKSSLSLFAVVGAMDMPRLESIFPEISFWDEGCVE